MPIHQSLWRLTDTAERLSTAQLQTEKQLEDFIVGLPPPSERSGSTWPSARIAKGPIGGPLRRVPRCCRATPLGILSLGLEPGEGRVPALSPLLKSNNLSTVWGDKSPDELMVRKLAGV
jgi:hypothetical protein